jgi:VWFA-related protein
MRTFAGLFVTLIVCVASGQDAPPVFTSTSEMVLVEVQVVHSKSKFATPALRKLDFQVFEDGAAREIAFLSRDELPLSIVLPFDLTQSIRPVLQRLSASAAAALTHLKPQDDVAVMTYAASATLVGGFTTDRKKHVLQTARRAGPERASTSGGMVDSREGWILPQVR